MKELESKFKTLIILILSVFVLVFLSLLLKNLKNPRNILAQTSCSVGNYIWCKRQVVNISPQVSAYKALIRNEIQKLINKGHLAPARIVIGENPIYSAWGNPADVVYALSRAYPYFSDDPSFQSNIRTYLQEELSTYPLWDIGFKSINQGVNPDPYNIDLREEVTCSVWKNNTFHYLCIPRLWNIYALWLYAENTGDWNYIQSNWSSIIDLFNSNNPPQGPNDAPNYEDIAGAIAVVRIARRIDQPYQNAENLVNNLISSLTNFSSARTNSLIRYNTGPNYMGQNYPLPFTQINDGTNSSCPGNRPPVLYHLTPEVAKFINENSSLKNSVVSYFNEVQSLYPLWFVNRGNWLNGGCDLMAYHESTSFPPVYLSWMFPSRAWIIGNFAETGDQLKPYVDGPYNPVGDLDYINNLITLYEAYGTTSWCDVTSGSCEAIPTPTPPPSCTLSSASWSTSGSLNEGTLVTLIVNGNNCSGRTISFEVREDDGVLGSDLVRVNPANAVFSGNTATTTWVAEYQPDCGGLCDPPEYFFTATLVGTSTTIRSSDPMLNVNPQGFPTPTPSPTRIPTLTPTLTPTPTRVPTPTPLPPTPTQTPTPTTTLRLTPTPTPIPTPTPSPCTLTSARWDTTSNPVNEGTPVNLVVNGTNCNGKEVSFEVRENDSILEGGFDEAANTQPANAIFSGSTASTTWIAEFQNDCGGLCNPPEYFFNTTLVGTSTTIRSSDPMLNVNQAPFPTPTLPPSSTPTPTPTPVPTATSTPTPSPTVGPTLTPSPTPTGVPTPTPPLGPCSLSSAVWDVPSNPVDEGTEVSLIVTGSGNCSGQTVSFEVREDDFGQLIDPGDDPVANNPQPATFTGNVAETTWVAEYQQDCSIGGIPLCDPPEYYFNAQVSGQTLRSLAPLLEVNQVVIPAPTPTLTPSFTLTPTPTLRINLTPTPFSAFLPPQGGSGGSADGGGAPAAPPGPSSVRPDLNGDGRVNIFDLSILLSNYGKSGSGDLNSDGRVNIFDLSILLANYGR